MKLVMSDEPTQTITVQDPINSILGMISST